MGDQVSGYGIGALAVAAGVSVDTLRYYEREGLLPRASRTAGGTRRYAPEAAERVRFIKQAQMMGWSLREIRQLVAPDNVQCAAVRTMIAERLADADRRLLELASFRRMLQIALERCDQTLGGSKNAACNVVQQLGTKTLSRVDGTVADEISARA